MDTSKTFLIVIVCIFQVYAQEGPVDIKQEFSKLLVTFMKEIAPVRQSYINAIKNGDHKADGGLKYIQYQQNQQLVYNEFGTNINQLIATIESNKPGYESDDVDKTLVSAFKDISQETSEFLEPLKELQPADYEAFILNILETYLTAPYILPDFGNAVLQYLNDYQLAFEKYRKDFEGIKGLDVHEEVERFEEIMADVTLDVDELDRKFINLFDVLD